MVSPIQNNFNSLESVNLQFPAIRGIQAGKEYYVTLFPLKLIPKIFIFDESEIPPKMRAQRVLNHARIPQIANYIISNPKDYIFSSLTASIDGRVEFTPFGEKGNFSKIGTISIPLTARFIINDGQHRRAAIEEALKSCPELGNESISVVLFLDSGLKRSQQMFADLNKHAVQPTRSLGILYDSRDPLAKLAIELADTVPIFKGLTDFEKSTISNRSIKLFTLSSIYQATQSLLKKTKNSLNISPEERQTAFDYWDEVAKNIPEWCLIIDRKVTSSELRKDYVHVHGVILHALGMAGKTLLEKSPDTWKQELIKLRSVDWSRSNASLWEGRSMIGGRISKAQMNLVLTSNAIKNILGLPLSVEEQQAEDAFQKGM
ncbi:MAG: DNA sulfur modification protein DndB [Prolixibacteraceae bacterium]|jgi:DNA sulfur modification protein DndB|nr:DNA sulfur modification protein DndB [Prolixibacteraceae bacterium]